MIIRRAEADDLGALTEIYNQAVALGQCTADMSPLTVDDRRGWFDSHREDKYPLLVAEDEGCIAGYFTISPYRPGRRALRYTGEVSYYVHCDYHGKGVASRLMEEGIASAVSLGFKSLFAILIDTNKGSRRLLEKYNFEKWGHLPGIADYDGEEVGQYYYGLRIAP